MFFNRVKKQKNHWQDQDLQEFSELLDRLENVKMRVSGVEKVRAHLKQDYLCDKCAEKVKEAREEWQRKNDEEMQRRYEKGVEAQAREMLIEDSGRLQRHIFREMGDLLLTSDKVFVSFRFDWKTYKSNIVITGRAYENGKITYSQEKLIRTPQIPLMGGVWSNAVAMRMLSGQVLVSAMLENTANAIKYGIKYDVDDIVTRSKGKPLEVVKIDRCMYAPLLHLSEYNEAYEEISDEYMDYLIENHKEAYNQLLKYKNDNLRLLPANFWKEYHDADVEAVF